MKDFKFFGFKINTKNFLIAIGLYALLIGVLLIIHNFWFDVSWYGVIIGTGFLVAIIIACELMKERDLKKDFPFDLIWWIFPLAIIGARLYYVIFTPEYNWTFLEILNIRSGGLAIYGGIIGGAIGLIICCLIKKQNILKTIDVAAPCLILGQAIGRWGNFINQEAYGYEITNPNLQWFPIGVYIENQSGWYLATFFYESMWNLIGFFLLVILLRKCKATGVCLGGYLTYYGLGRVWIEGLRTDSLYIANTSIRVSQLLSLVLIFVGVLILIFSIIYYNKNHKNLNKVSFATKKGKVGERIIDNLPDENNNNVLENVENNIKINKDIINEKTTNEKKEKTD